MGHEGRNRRCPGIGSVTAPGAVRGETGHDVFPGCPAGYPITRTLRRGGFTGCPRHLIPQARRGGP